MKKILAPLMFVCSLAAAQTTSRFPPINLYNGDPTGNACTGSQIQQSSTTGLIYTCQGGIMKTGGGGTGTITAVTASTGITGGGSSGNVSVAVDGTAVPFLSNANTFTNTNIFATATAATLGGSRYAAQWVNGGGNNGLANAAATGQWVIADPGYTGTDFYCNSLIISCTGHLWSPGVNQGAAADLRNGGLAYTFSNPGGTLSDNSNSAVTINVNNSLNQGPNIYGRPKILNLNAQFNQPSANYGTPPVGPTNWTVGKGIDINMVSASEGIHEALSSTSVKAGIGDNTGPYFYNTSYGGQVEGSGEGNHPLSYHGDEANTTFKGTVATGGGGSGATTVHVACTTDCGGMGGPGDGRYLVDQTVLDSGNITSCVTGTYSSYTCAIDHSITASTAYGTLSGNCNAGSAPTPLGTGYNTVTCSVNSVSGAFSTTGLVCFSGQFHEQALVTGVTGSGPYSLTMALRHAHQSGSAIFQGGPCGTYLNITANSQTVNTVLDYPIDIIGAQDSTHLNIATFIAGTDQTLPNGLGNLYAATWSATNLVNTGGIVTMTCGAFCNGNNISFYANATTMQISGASVSAYNGACTNAKYWPNINSVTCTQSSSNGAGTAATATVTIGTSQYGNSAYTTWAGAETLDVLDYSVSPPVVYNFSNSQNTFTLEPNIAAWANSDAVEQAHHYSIKIGALFGDNEWNPYATAQSFQSLTLTGAGICCGNVQTPYNGTSALTINNAQPAATYAYHGGYKNPPGGLTLGSNSGSALFNWGLNMLNAPDPIGATAIYVGCPLSGCTDLNYTYSMLTAQTNGGFVTMGVRPSQSEWTFGGNVIFSTPNFAFTRMNDRIDFTAVTVPTLSTPTAATTGGTLTDSTPYYYTVYAVNNSGSGAQSTEKTVTTGASGGNTNSITLTWSRSQGAVQYVVCRGATTGTETKGPVLNGVDSTTWVDRGTQAFSGSCPATDGTLGYINNTAKVVFSSANTGFGATVSAPASVAGNYSLGLPATGTAANLVDEPVGATVSGNAICHVNTTGQVGACATGAKFGTHTTTGTTTPLLVDLGGTYGTNTPGSNGNIKLAIYYDSTAIYGIGLSNGNMEYDVPVGTSKHSFYINGSLAAAISSSAFNIPTGSAYQINGTQISSTNLSDSTSILKNVNTCGTTTTCANTAQTSPRIVHGNVALTAGSAVVGSMTAWTATTSFDCTGTDKTASAAVQIVNTSTTSITITGTGTDVIAYVCVGN